MVSSLVEDLLDQVAYPLEERAFSSLGAASYLEEVHESAFLGAAFLNLASVVSLEEPFLEHLLLFLGQQVLEEVIVPKELSIQLFP